MAGRTQFVTNAGALASTKRLLADQVHANLRSAANLHAEKMKATAIRLSSGTLSTQQLQKMGHPYSRRFPAGFAVQPDFVINSQSGVFKASWRTRVQETGKGWTITLLNDAPEAKYMMGTKSMRVRPILIEVERVMHGDLPAKTRKVTRKAGQENGAGGGSVFGGILFAVSAGVTSAAGGFAEGLGE